MPDDPSHILVAGASGVIGTAATEHFSRLSGWRVSALSRRTPVLGGDVEYNHIAANLLDREACAANVTDLGITHLIYAAVVESPGLAAGWRDPELMALNGEMFANLLIPLVRSGSLRHVSLLQGAKAYGAHVHPVTVPLREDGVRDAHPNFYWLHEDLLRASAAAHGFRFTIFRPQVLLGWPRELQ